MSSQLLSIVSPLITHLESFQNPFSQFAATQREYYSRLRSQGNSLTEAGNNQAFVGSGADAFTGIIVNDCNTTEKLLQLLEQLDSTAKICINEISTATNTATSKIMSASIIPVIGYLEEQLVSHVLESLTLNDIIQSGASVVQAVVNRMWYSWQDAMRTEGNFFGHPLQSIEQLIGGGMHDLEIKIDQFFYHLEQALSQWAQQVYDAVRKCIESISSLTPQPGAIPYLNGPDNGNTQMFPPFDSPSKDPGNPFYQYYGQCTWWATERIHQLTGLWVPMTGNAYQWRDQAIQKHWQVSTTPSVGSIIVLQPGTKGIKSSDGHVAVVEQILPNGWVLTSNMNWPPGSTRVTYVMFHYPDTGVSFISSP